MAEPESRDLSGRKGSLLSLVRDRAEEASAFTAADRVGDIPEDWKAAAMERHQRARSRRDAATSPLVAALGNPPLPPERDADLFSEQEDALRRILAESPEPTEDARTSEDTDFDTGERETARHLPQRDPAAFRAYADGPEGHEWRGGSGHRSDDAWRPLIDPAKVIGGIWKSRYLVLGTTIAGALLAALIAMSTPKHYTAVAELLVDPRELQIVANDVTAGGGLSTEATLAIVENQVRVLTSGSVLTKVVEQLGLDKDPEFNGTSAGIGSYIPNLREIFFSESVADDPSIRRKALAVDSLARSLVVERGGRTFVVEIWARSESPEKSALIANTVTEVFLEISGAIQSRTVGRASDELTQRLAELRKGVEDAERKVEAFKSQNDIVDAQGRLITDDEIVKLNDQLAIARARTLELQARADFTRDLTVDAILAGNLPEQMSSPVLTEMRTQYSLLRQDADRVSARLGPRHPERVAIEEQVAAARQRIEQELRLVASSIQVELRRAVQLEQELAARLAQLKARQADLSEELVTLRELEREATAKRAVYESFLLRARETGEQKDINTANVSVISPATPPLEASSISRSFTTIFGAVLGFGVGVLFGAGRGAVDSLTEGAGPARRPRPTRTEAPLPPRRPEPARRVPSKQGAEPDVGASEDEMYFAATGGAEMSDAGDEANELEVSARNEAQEVNPAEEAAVSAEEAEMYHQKPQNAWGPSRPMDDQASYPSYDRPQQPAANWPDYPQAGPSQHGNFAQQPAGMPGQGNLQHQVPPAHGYAQHGQHLHAPQQAYAHPYGHGGYPAQPQPYPSAPHAQQQPLYGYPAAQGYPPMDPALAMYGQPAHPWQYGQHPGHQFAPTAPHGQMPADMRQPYAPAAYAEPASAQQVYPRNSLHDLPAEHSSHAPAAEVRPSANPDKTAIDEIRESLREFREALRELAENRGRRRFL